MDPLNENKLDELLRLTKDNNKILHKIRRGQVWQSIVRVIYWVVILAGIYGTYKYLGPTFKSLYEVYNSAFTTEGSSSPSLLQNLGGYGEIQSLLEKYNLK